MPYKEEPKFKSIPEKMLEVPQPAIGGLNLKDLEFEQEITQSPYLMNVMYRNGAFGKRYGQGLMQSSNGDLHFEDEVYSMTSFDGYVVVHAGTKIYKCLNNEDPVEIGSGFPLQKGLFIVFAQKLYYLAPTGLHVLEEDTFSLITDTYVPDILINCKPDGTHSDPLDEFNLLSDKFSFVYNGEENVDVYKVGDYDPEDTIDWDVTPTIIVDDEETSDFTVDKTDKLITFTTAPQQGDMNVVITFTMKDGTFAEERSQILNCKFYETFGGANNSRLFVAGGGYSKYFYTQAYDITYFPEYNFATIGNTEEDITGFGRQYNVLIVFKPREIYSIYSYTQTSATTVSEEEIGMEGFKSQLVNARVGCDAPYSIQLINNLLTWFNSNEGVCTLVSTNVQDERNVRIISRNIERTNNFNVRGVLDFEDDPNTVQSADYNNKYFLCFPADGLCFVWDYEISPYRYSSNGETDPRQLDWFLFNRFYVKQFVKVKDQLLYSSTHQDYSDCLVKLNASFEDLDFNGDGKNDAIHSYYMTPFMQFSAVEYLKNVRNIFVQCRGDTNTLINISYLTNESSEAEIDPEPISVGGHGVLWKNFLWGTFRWSINNWGNTFRRRCNLKHIQMCAVLFENNEVGMDMSITHISFAYQIVREVKQ